MASRSRMLPVRRVHEGLRPKAPCVHRNMVPRDGMPEDVRPIGEMPAFSAHTARKCPQAGVRTGLAAARLAGRQMRIILKYYK